MTAIKFPIQTKQGKSEVLTRLSAIQQSVLQRLMTQQGSVFFDRSFGSRLYELLFEPNDLVRKSLAYTFCKEALETESRIKLRAIEINQADKTMEIRVIYTLLSSNEIETINFEI